MPKLKMTLTPREEYTIEDIRQAFGGCLLNVTAVGKYLNCTRQTAAKWLADVDSIKVNGRRLYQAADIARKIEGSRERGREA